MKAITILFKLLHITFIYIYSVLNTILKTETQNLSFLPNKNLHIRNA